MSEKERKKESDKKGGDKKNINTVAAAAAVTLQPIQSRHSSVLMQCIHVCLLACLYVRMWAVVSQKRLPHATVCVRVCCRCNSIQQFLSFSLSHSILRTNEYYVTYMYKNVYKICTAVQQYTQYNIWAVK